jgi:hypothetical protein
MKTVAKMIEWSDAIRIGEESESQKVEFVAGFEVDF